jgi:Protein of unknown function (DUF1320)
LSYLIAQDYLKQIQEQNLQAVISSTPSIQAVAELAAQEECISYLIQKYDTEAEFTDTLLYDPTAATYNAMSRVYLNASAYVAMQAYAVGALTLYQGNVYICKTIIAGEAWTIAHWTLLGAQYQLFFAIFPELEFKLYWLYNVGDLAYWKGRIYSCLKNTRLLGHQDLIQAYNTENIPYPNFFPDDPVNGPGQWYDQGAYSIPAGGLLSVDPVYFIPGDNRSQMLVLYMIDMVLYHLHSRISPRNIPEIRAERYEAAKSWLKNVARGNDITAPIPKKQPPQGRRIRSGSNIKNQNGY